jgi:hypothetical protein
MKKVFILFALLGLFACKDEPDDTRIYGKTEISQALAIGTWQITQYIDSGTDKTGTFSGYSFTFHVNGTLSATKGSSAVYGNWYVSDGLGDDNPGGLDLNISFTSPAIFEELTDNWKIIYVSNRRVELEHVSGGNGGTDYLSFEKN